MLGLELKERICRVLLDSDPKIAEVIRFGSSVYAPEYAKDLDLLVLTEKKKDYGGYLDIVDKLELPFDIDIVVREIGEPLKNSFACQVLGAFEILYGDGRYLAEITKDFAPDFEEAKSYLRGAKEYFDLARRTENEYDKDRNIRMTFNSLFHAARIASMAFLAMENARWGRIKEKLPQPYKAEFEEFINILHTKYFYNGDYSGKVEEEFEKWHQKARKFVRELEAKS